MWFSNEVSRDNQEAHDGAYSLKVAVTAPQWWEIQFSNWPGFATNPGPKRSYLGEAWCRQRRQRDHEDPLVRCRAGTSTDGLYAHPDHAAVGTGGADIQAPDGTASVFMELYDSAGSVGDVIYFDDLVVSDVASP